MKENLISEESARPTLSEPIQDEPEEKDEWEKKSCCCKCCHYLFCCCCCTNYEKSKSSYRKGWRKYLTNEGNDASDESFTLLTNLFANVDNAIEGLEGIRLNPNLVSENKLRNDLEFYIPQLCTFLSSASSNCTHALSPQTPAHTRSPSSRSAAALSPR